MASDERREHIAKDISTLLLTYDLDDSDDQLR